MLYNVLLVSAVHQSESAIHIHIPPLFWTSFPIRSPQRDLIKLKSFRTAKETITKTKRQSPLFFSIILCLQHFFLLLFCREWSDHVFNLTPLIRSFICLIKIFDFHPLLFIILTHIPLTIFVKTFLETSSFKIFFFLCGPFFFFLMWTIFKVFIEFVTMLLLFYVLFFWPGGMWDPGDQGSNLQPLSWKAKS